MKADGELKRQIEEAFAAIQVDSPHEYTFAGRKFPVQPLAQPQAPHGPAPGVQQTDDPRSNSFIMTLSTTLYEHVYSRAFRGAIAPPQSRDFSPDQDLLAELSTANATRERWEYGWRISQVMQNGQIMAQKGNHQRSLWPGQFISKDGPAMMPRQGAEISVFYPKESLSLQDGFYYAFGEAAEDETRAFGLVRLYWNVRLFGTPKLVGLLTARLNRFHVPFRMKVATARSQYDRTDVAVVYLGRRYYRITADLMLDVHPQVAELLDDDVPLFSKPVAKGLGVAEDPGTGESFGQSRCLVMAESVWNCFLRGEQSTSARDEEFLKLAAKHGIDVEHPHLNAGSLDWYELPPEVQ